MSEINTNAWLGTHGKRVDYLIYELEKYRMSGSYGGNLDLREIITLFKSAKTEITILSKKIKELEEKIIELEGTDNVQDNM